MVDVSTCPAFRPLLRALQTFRSDPCQPISNANCGSLHSKGRYRGGCIVQLARTGRPQIELSSGGVADRFHIRIPFAGRELNWQVIFNSLAPDCPPDFDFNDDPFTSTLDAECLEKEIPSLAEWNHRDTRIFLKILSEYLSLYRRYQMKLILEEEESWSSTVITDTRSNYTTRFSEILAASIINEDDVELYCEGDDIHFLFILYPDMSDYKLIFDHVLDKSFSVSGIVHKSTRNRMSKLQVRFSDKLRPHLSSCVPIDDGQPLLEYLIKLYDAVQDSLTKSFTDFLLPLGKRKRFVFTWLSIHKSRVIEYDALEFKKMTILLEENSSDNSFRCLLFITIPEDFPMEPPQYKLQSIYSELLLTVDVRTRHNVKWSFEEMIVFTKASIQFDLRKLKSMCLKTCI